MREINSVIHKVQYYMSTFPFTQVDNLYICKAKLCHKVFNGFEKKI